MGWSQIFLQFNFTKQSRITSGEAEVEGYQGQIVLSDFDWGMKAGKDVAKGSGLARRVNAEEIKVTKRFDSSSTALMTAMKKRDKFISARITVAQSFADDGEGARDAFVLEANDGYIESIDLDLVADGNAMVLQEELVLRYTKLRIEVVEVTERGTYSNTRSIFDSECESMGLSG